MDCKATTGGSLIPSFKKVSYIMLDDRVNGTETKLSKAAFLDELFKFRTYQVRRM